MSRSKKSRKPSAFDINPIKEERKTTTISEPRKPRKRKGKPAGSRQQEAFQTKGNNQHGNAKKDPRLGSKKPIDLTPGKTKPLTATPPVKAEKKAESAIANIRVVEADDSLQQELYAIEEDNKLQQILAKQDDDVALTEAEVDYYNEKMARHQELSTLLGLDDEEGEDGEDQQPDHSENSADNEDALWDKLDNSDLSRFK